MMDDMISRVALLKQCAECQKTDPRFEGRGWANHFINDAGEPSTEWYCVEDMIENAPVVDAVPVVRCSECKYAHMTYDGECKYCDFWQEDGGDALYLDKGFYCAAGERRDGDANG